MLDAFLARVKPALAPPLEGSPLEGHSRIDANAHRTCRSSIFLGRIVGAMFMRVNAKCAHQLRPPPSQL